MSRSISSARPEKSDQFRRRTRRRAVAVARVCPQLRPNRAKKPRNRSVARVGPRRRLEVRARVLRRPPLENRRRQVKALRAEGGGKLQPVIHQSSLMLREKTMAAESDGGECVQAFRRIGIEVGARIVVALALVFVADGRRVARAEVEVGEPIERVNDPVDRVVIHELRLAEWPNADRPVAEIPLSVYSVITQAIARPFVETL